MKHSCNVDFQWSCVHCHLQRGSLIFYLKYIDDRFTVAVVAAAAAAAAADNVDGDYDGGAGFHVTQGVSLLLLSEEPDVCYVRDASEEPKSCLKDQVAPCLLYTSPSPRDRHRSRMPSSA